MIEAFQARIAGAVVLAASLALTGGCESSPPRPPTEAVPIDLATVPKIEAPRRDLMRSRKVEIPGYEPVQPAADAPASAEEAAPSASRPTDPAAARVPATAEGALLVPRPEVALAGLHRWLRQLAEARAIPGRGGRLEQELTLLFGVNLLDPEALAQIGLDPRAPAALWWEDGGFTVSLGVGDAAAARAWVGGERGRSRRLPTLACKVAALADPGGRAPLCDSDGGLHLRVALADDGARLRLSVGGPMAAGGHRASAGRADAGLAGTPAYRDLPDPGLPLGLFLRIGTTGAIHLGLSPDAGGLVLRGSVTRDLLPLDAGAAPCAGLERLESALVIRARLDRTLPLLDDLGPDASLGAVCPRCGREAAEALRSAVSGSAALLVLGFDPEAAGDGPARPSDVFFIARHAWVAPVRSGGAARAAVGALAKALRRGGLAPAPDGGDRAGTRWRVPVQGRGEVRFGVADGLLYLGSDRRAIAAALGAGAASGGRALSLRIDPAVLAESFVEEATPAERDGGFLALLLDLGRGMRAAAPTHLEAWPEGPVTRIAGRLPSPPTRAEVVGEDPAAR